MARARLPATAQRQAPGLTGEVSFDEQNDDMKILGVYSTEQRARERAAQARSLPGFADEPDCFMVHAYTLDEHLWTDGYFSYKSYGSATRTTGTPAS